MSITRSFGDESKLTQSNEDAEDEPIYSNHKYFDEESMGSIQKCNVFIIMKIIQFYQTDKKFKIKWKLPTCLNYIYIHEVQFTTLCYLQVT